MYGHYCDSCVRKHKYMVLSDYLRLHSRCIVQLHSELDFGA